ncbi:hypothetical protein Rhopal_000138-T1 [Rhodotorula paludigena]|uniref:Origin recognition complex subunit 5 C-terminal domain-containing protein n=1 Tax=Rhodotorula paludigena TaxID=86838 RepID=A0AAV5GAT4_9BASI|nr:hypothetical protein Rhopal_000138-T1 [Rhodotorula paludigena]
MATVLPSLASFHAQFAALVASPFPPDAVFVHNPADSPVLAELVHDTLERVAAPPRSKPTAGPPPLDALLPTVAHLDLAGTHSTKAAFDSVLNQLSGWDSASGPGGAPWDERDGGVRAWDGTSLAGLTVVRAKKRKHGGANGVTRASKRARTDGETHTDAADDLEGQQRDDEDEWSLEWDRAALSGADKPALTPLRNTVDAFHHSLRTIFAASAPSSAPRDPASALDAAVDLRPAQSQPRRRFIIIERGELLSELAGSATGAAKETCVGVTFASTMHRLGQITGLPITVITLSRLPWRKAREAMVGLPSPELLTFDDLSAADTVTLLTSRFAKSPASLPSASDSLTQPQLVDLFRSLAHVVRTTFGKAVTELDEFAFLCARFWPRWKETRERSNPPIAPTDTARLSIALKADFAAELDRLFLPRTSLSFSTASGVSGPSASSAAAATAATASAGFAGTISAPRAGPAYLDSPAKDPSDFFASAAVASASADSPFRPSTSFSAADPFLIGPSTPLKQQSLPARSASSALSSRAPQQQQQVSAATSLARSLPLCARYLLLAAYFAAHNPPKSDVRMFVRVDELDGPGAGKGKAKGKGGKAKRKGGGGGRKSPKKAARSSALHGGKPFAYERLVALYDSIVDARLEPTLGAPAVAAQVQTLVALRLLSRASSDNNAERVLDGVKLRCAVEREVADALAASVGWREWKERLVGEED